MSEVLDYAFFELIFTVFKLEWWVVVNQNGAFHGEEDASFSDIFALLDEPIYQLECFFEVLSIDPFLNVSELATDMLVALRNHFIY